ncbi:hypothetical protein [Haliangium sp.]|uniref:T4 family baseplate hub assembly chaperone n=1 Tax=Haliangium sp. TaxID=2663208 RepID=UPI003D0AFC09
MTHVIECPSGLRGEIRGLKVKELDYLADRRLAKSGQQLDRILAGCWLETVDAGPYSLGERGLDWDQVLQGDRFYAMLEIRAASLGATYAFAAMCQGGACGCRFEWEVSLDELPVRALSDDARQNFRDGNRFESVLPGAAKRVWFRLPVGADEKRLAKHRQARQGELWSTMLALRVVEIEGVAGGDKRRFLGELDLADAEHLRRAFDEADCGVETTIEVECPECALVQDVELPFDHGFFLAQRPKKGSSH